MATVEELRMQHKLACDKIVERLETKSSRGEGPSRVLRKVLRHFDQSEGQLMLSGDEFVQAMERIGTKLTPSDLDLLLTVYNVEGAGFDGQRFTADLFGEGGHQTSMINNSGLNGGIFSQDNTPREGPPRPRQHSNNPSMPGGPYSQEMYMPQQQAPKAKVHSNDSSVPGGIFGQAPSEPFHPNKRGSRTNVSSIPGGIFG
mmetsp:Transcript_18592/g.54448  ORF Transcript_18592/g.54448 Transcript_18592/m.54448 type:complete len:201 (-) Transcript_18592:522-1124(-)